MNKKEILTERTRLRLIELSDLNSIHELHSLLETDEYNALGIPKNIEETKSIIRPWIEENQLIKIKNHTFAIEQKERENLLDYLDLNSEMKNIKEQTFGIKYTLTFGTKDMQQKP